MLKKAFVSFFLALQNIKANFFHTMLSVLGIIIGVAALVAILSLIDGMEEFAHEQISKTTSLEFVMLQPEIYEEIDGLRIRKEDYAYLDYDDFQQLSQRLKGEAEVFISFTRSTKIVSKQSGRQFGVRLAGVGENISPDLKLVKGEVFSEEDLKEGLPGIVLSTALADKLSAGVGAAVAIDNKTYTVKGISDDGEKAYRAAIPITGIEEEQLKANPPQITIKAGSVERVPQVQKDVEQWLSEAFPDHTKDFAVHTNNFRVEQANKGFLMFRIIMGLIVGISVVVGGIGVMNVLLISVNERTSEIGVRKAAGAKKFDILLQFLFESIAISGLGSLAGLIIGMLGTMVIVPIIKSVTKMPFSAAYTADTLVIISLVALFVGVIFGTYPALRASRLDPVEAIRRE